MQVSEAVPCGAGDDVAPLPCTLHVSDTTPCAGGGSAEGGYTCRSHGFDNGYVGTNCIWKNVQQIRFFLLWILTCGEVVCLCGEDDVSHWVPSLILAGLRWVFWVNTLQLHPFDTTRHISHWVSVSRNTHTYNNKTSSPTCCCRRTWWRCWGCCAAGCPLWDWKESLSAPARRSPSAPGRTSDDCARWDTGVQRRHWRIHKKTLSNKNYRAQQHAEHKAVLLICGLHTDPPVGLGQVETLHTGGVPFNPLEHWCVVVQVPGVKGKTCINNNTYYDMMLLKNKSQLKREHCKHIKMFKISSFHSFKGTLQPQKKELLSPCCINRLDLVWNAEVVWVCKQMF